MKTQDILVGLAENDRRLDEFKASLPTYSLAVQAEVAVAMYNLGTDRRITGVDRARMARVQEDPNRGITWEVYDAHWVGEDGSDEYFTTYGVLDAGMAGVEELRANIEAGAILAAEMKADHDSLAERMKEEEELVRLMDKFGVEIS